MKKQTFKQIPSDFCLCCDMGMKTHTLTVRDYQKNTVYTVTVKCNKQR
jgi:hypothetical protein